MAGLGSRASVCVVSGLVLAAGCTTQEGERAIPAAAVPGQGTEAPARTTLEVPGVGLAVTYPGSWQATGLSLTAVVWPADRLAVASYPLPEGGPDPDCYPEAALSALPADGVLIRLIEYTNEPFADELGLPVFPPRPSHFSLDPAALAEYECFGKSYLIRFRENGRAFQAHVSLGERAGAAERAAALATLDSLTVSPETVTGS